MRDPVYLFQGLLLALKCNNCLMSLDQIVVTLQLAIGLRVTGADCPSKKGQTDTFMLTLKLLLCSNHVCITVTSFCYKYSLFMSISITICLFKGYFVNLLG